MQKYTILKMGISLEHALKLNPPFKKKKDSTPRNESPAALALVQKVLLQMALGLYPLQVCVCVCVCVVCVCVLWCVCGVCVSVSVCDI